MLRTQVYLDEDDYQEVANLAAMMGIKKAAMMRRVVKRGVVQVKKEQKKKDDWKKEWLAEAKMIRDKGLSGWKDVDVEKEIDEMRQDRY